MKEIILSQRFFPEIGGSIKWLYEVYRRFPSKVTLITHSYPNDSYNDAELEKEFEIKRKNILLSNWGLDSFDSIKKYIKMHSLVSTELSKNDYVRVHCTHAIPEALSLFFLKKKHGFRLQIICYAHGEEILACKSSQQLNFLQKKAYNLCDKIIANSLNTANLVSQYLQSKEKIKIIHPGSEVFSENKIKSLKLSFLEKHPELESKNILLSIGRLEPKKNHIKILEALASLKNEGAHFTYLIAGKGSEENLIRKKIETLGLNETVKLLGEVTEHEKLELLASCLFFIMPSVVEGNDLEGFGIAFIEAACLKKTSISGNSGGQTEAVINNSTGLAINGKNTEEIKKAVKKLLENQTLRTTLEINAYNRSKNFSWDKIAEETLVTVKS